MTPPTTPAPDPTLQPQEPGSSRAATIIPRFAFIFLIYTIITTGYVTETLSCQMRKYLVTTHHGRHVFGMLMVFAFIMMEGGWSFDKRRDDEAPNNWSSGNVVHSLVIAAAIYAVFIVSSKSRLVPNLIFFGLLLVLYLVNTQRAYLEARRRISPEANARVLAASKVLLGVTVAVLAYGLVDYARYQSAARGSDFSWRAFFLGPSQCASLGAAGAPR